MTNSLVPPPRAFLPLRTLKWIQKWGETPGWCGRSWWFAAHRTSKCPCGLAGAEGGNAQTAASGVSTVFLRIFVVDQLCQFSPVLGSLLLTSSRIPSCASGVRAPWISSGQRRRREALAQVSGCRTDSWAEGYQLLRLYILTPLSDTIGTLWFQRLVWSGCLQPTIRRYHCTIVYFLYSSCICHWGEDKDQISKIEHLAKRVLRRVTQDWELPHCCGALRIFAVGLHRVCSVLYFAGAEEAVSRCFLCAAVVPAEYVCKTFYGVLM